MEDCIVRQTCDADTQHSSLSEESSSDSVDHRVAPTVKWNKLQWLTLVTTIVVQFAADAACSLPAAFFPAQAVSKGASSFEIGLILGFYELVIFITSPIYGILVVRTGPKFQIVGGSVMAGGACILFGYLENTPDGAAFIAFALLIRALQANGSSMLMVGGCSILPKTFPSEVGWVNSLSEMMCGTGAMIGPVLGAALFDNGNYQMPYLVFGSLFLLIAAIVFFTQPPVEESDVATANFLRLLCNPGIAILYIHVTCIAVSLNFLIPIFQNFLTDNFEMSNTLIGVMFLLQAGLFALTSPLAGKLADRGFMYSLMIGGSALVVISLILCGPAPFLNSIFGSDKHLALLIVSCLLLGIGGAFAFIPPYNACLELITLAGYERDLMVYGLLSGLISSSYSLGAFIGPAVSGLLTDSLGFEWAVSLCGGFVLLITIVLIIFLLVMRLNKKRLILDENTKVESLEDETQPLLLNA